MIEELFSPLAARTKVIGHRGAMGHAPENTMASFNLGLQMGADLLELDVHLSRDEHVVVIHDHTLGRTNNGRGLVKETDLGALMALDAGAWFGPAFAGERIPTLDEVLTWARGRVPVIVEIKNGPVYYPGIEKKVVDLARALGVVRDTVAISFDHACVAAVKELEPQLFCGILFACKPVDAIALGRQSGADALLPHWSYTTPEMVETAHRAGLAVCPWTADDPELMRTLLDMRVDAIGTNYPDRLRQVVDVAAAQYACPRPPS